MDSYSYRLHLFIVTRSQCRNRALAEVSSAEDEQEIDSGANQTA